MAAVKLHLGQVDTSGMLARSMFALYLNSSYRSNTFFGSALLNTLSSKPETQSDAMQSISSAFFLSSSDDLPTLPL
jgi:hypothetical protein